MGRLAHQAEADAGLFGALDRERRGLHHRHRPETVVAIEHEGRGAIMRQRRLRLGVDLAVGDDVEIARQPRHAVTVAAAQIGPDQTLGDDGGVLGARAVGDQHFANEAAELVVADQNAVAFHSSSPLTATLMSFPAKAGNPVIAAKNFCAA